ncbi:MAG: hypothetical protein LBT95_01930 [Treponema sp.]|jgi:hypothetical protein|nr:hypothetical protein [Treponema sp.]
MNKGSVTTSRGEVVGIGKIKVFPSNNLPYEIPMLSFLVVKEQENVYSSICIHLHIDGDGASPEEARESMKDHILDFLHENFTKERAQGAAWDHLKSLFLLDGTTGELWDAYRTLQVKFSQDGIQTDITAELLDRIEYLQNQISKLNTVKEKLEKKLAEKAEIGWEYKQVS